jgi:hypothetical protein
MPREAGEALRHGLGCRLKADRAEEPQGMDVRGFVIRSVGWLGVRAWSFQLMGLRFARRSE